MVPIGVETADMLVNEVLSRHPSDGKAIPPLCRPHRLAGRERQTPTREGLGARWQCSRPLRHDPVTASNRRPRTNWLPPVRSKLRRGAEQGQRGSKGRQGAGGPIVDGSAFTQACCPSSHARVHSIKHLATFRDIREQHIHEGVLAIERRTSLIFGRNDSLNCSEVALTERVVLRAKETFAPSCLGSTQSSMTRLRMNALIVSGPSHACSSNPSLSWGPSWIARSVSRTRVFLLVASSLLPEKRKTLTNTRD